MSQETLDPRKHDELCRISRQGMDQAAEMLSRLLRQPVSVEVADVWMSDQQHSVSMATGDFLGIYMGVSGDITGGLLLVLSESCAEWLSRQLLGTETIGDLLQEPVSSTLKEVGNILSSSFLASLDDQLGLRALPSPPVLSHAPIIDILEGCQPSREDVCLVVRTRLLGTGDAADNLQGAIYLFPEAAALDHLVARIGHS